MNAKHYIRKLRKSCRVNIPIPREYTKKFKLDKDIQDMLKTLLEDAKNYSYVKMYEEKYSYIKETNDIKNIDGAIFTIEENSFPDKIKDMKYYDLKKACFEFFRIFIIVYENDEDNFGNEGDEYVRWTYLSEILENSFFNVIIDCICECDVVTLIEEIESIMTNKLFCEYLSDLNEGYDLNIINNLKNEIQKIKDNWNNKASD